MNVLIFNWRDIKHPLSGGAEISLFQHARYWVRKGAKVTWFSSSFNGAKRTEEIEGITFTRRGSHYTVHIFAYIYYKLGRLGRPYIIIDSFHFIPFFTPLYIKKPHVIALVNEVAGHLWFANLRPPLSFLGYFAEPFFFKFYRHVPFITGSDSAKKDLIRFGIAKGKINVIYHGIEHNTVANKYLREKYPTILFLGRISKDKGIEDAISTFIRIETKIKHVRFWIAGQEEKKGDYRKIVYKLLTKDNTLMHKIRYFGYVPENKKFELLKKAWILIHPSKKEGWGLTVIEAASQGTPTVGYNVEGLKDSVVHNKTGILTDTNPYALANGIIRVLLNKKLYNTLSKQARNWSKTFSWDQSGRESWKFINFIYDLRYSRH